MASDIERQTVSTSVSYTSQLRWRRKQACKLLRPCLGMCVHGEDMLAMGGRTRYAVQTHKSASGSVPCTKLPSLPFEMNMGSFGYAHHAKANSKLVKP